MSLRTRFLAPIALAVLLAAYLLWQERGGSDDDATPGDGAGHSAQAPHDPVLRSAETARPPNQGEAPPPDAAQPDATVVTFRDLADGQAVEGIRVRTTDAERGGTVATSGGDGTIRLPTEATGTLRLDASAWQLAENQLATTPLPSTLWVYRLAPLRITVTAAKGIAQAVPFEDVTVEVLSLGEPGRLAGDWGPDPWNANWMRRHGLDLTTLDLEVDAEGRTEAKVQRLRWLGILGRAPRWKSELVEVSCAEIPEDAPIDVLLVMKPVPTVKLRVTDAQGKPLRNASVSLNIVRITDAANLDYERIRIPGYSYGVIRRRDGTAFARWQAEGTTDAEGRLDFGVHVEGEIQLTTHARGHLPDRTAVLRLEGDKDVPITLTPSRGAASRVRLLWRGQPIREAKIVIHDITDIARQASMADMTDADGAMADEWLVSGRVYGLRAQGGNLTELLREGDHALGYLRWDGRREVHLSELPGLASDFVKQDAGK